MVQPFQCQCGAGPNQCLGLISGSRDIDSAVLRRYWLNDYVQKLLDEKARQEKRNSLDQDSQPALVQGSVA